MRAQDPGTLELVCTNSYCMPSYISVYVHLLILDCVQQVIIFMSNVLAVQSDPPTPPSIYYHHNCAVLLSPIYICYLRHPGANVQWCYSHSKYPSPPHLPYSHYPLNGPELVSAIPDMHDGTLCQSF